MTDELENRLRRVLRPVDAPEGFTERLMSRLPPRAEAVEKSPVVVLPTPVHPSTTATQAALAASARRTRQFGLPAALAASLIAAVMLGQHLGQQREQMRVQRELAEGREASRELMQALRVTSQKLDMAYQAVTNPPSTPADAEENPS